MVKEPRSQTNGKPPIIRHPLFPATVALWFGALFGLGSLAIRPGLLESLVLSLHLDAIIPAVAPPLGATARILLALFMAGTGGLLGAMLARRIARPKPVKRERKRGASAVGNAHKPARFAPYAVQNQEEPIALEEHAPRRRQLATPEEDVKPTPVYTEKAPLPGNAPHILDVSAFDLEGFESDARHDSEPEPRFAAHETSREPARDYPEALPEGAQVFEPVQANHAPTTSAAPPAMSAPASVETQEGAAPVPFASPADSPPAAALPSGHAPLRSELFDSYAQEIGRGRTAQAEHEQPGLARFAQPEPAEEDVRDALKEEEAPEPLPRFAAGHDGDGSAVPEAPARRSVFDPIPASRLFAEPVHARSADVRGVDTETPSETAPSPFAEPHASDLAPFGQPAGDEPSGTGDHAFDPPEQVVQTAPENTPDEIAESDYAPAAAGPETADAPREASAADRIAGAELDELSQVELLERLALSLQRRRNSQPSASTGAAPAHAATEAPEQPSVVVETTPKDGTGHTQAEVRVPEAFEPAAIPRTEPVAMPAALRPIGIDDEDDDDLLPSFVPPRHISMPQEPATEPNAPAQQDEPAEATGGEPPEDGEDENTVVLEEGYSSLLDLSRPAPGRQQFVRIEEPEVLASEIEPVVIFPGQEAAKDAPFARAPASQPEEAAAPFAKPAEQEAAQAAPAPAAPFTQPPDETATFGQPPFAPPQKQQRDPEETERALRSALATLQRMSGAA